MRTWHYVNLPDGREGVRIDPIDPLQVESITVTIRWNAKGIREFNRAIQFLKLSARIKQSFGEAKGRAYSRAFFVQGEVWALSELVAKWYILDWTDSKAKIATFGAGAGEEKPRGSAKPSVSKRQSPDWTTKDNRELQEATMVSYAPIFAPKWKPRNPKKRRRK